MSAPTVLCRSLSTRLVLAGRVGSRARYYAQRAHPLAPIATPPIPKIASKHQRWSTATLLTLATLTGSATYITGLLAGQASAPKADKASALAGGKLTAEGYAQGVRELESWMESDAMSNDRTTLVRFSTAPLLLRLIGTNELALDCARLFRVELPRCQGAAGTRTVPQEHRRGRENCQGQSSGLHPSSCMEIWSTYYRAHGISHKPAGGYAQCPGREGRGSAGACG